MSLIGLLAFFTRRYIILSDDTATVSKQPTKKTSNVILSRGTNKSIQISNTNVCKYHTTSVQSEVVSVHLPQVLDLETHSVDKIWCLASALNSFSEFNCCLSPTIISPIFYIQIKKRKFLIV
jgi:hypothetical protein